MASYPELQISNVHQMPPRCLMFSFGRLELIQKQVLFAKAEEMFNGMITNDKFCLTRWGQLHLSWWRRPLRLRG